MFFPSIKCIHISVEKTYTTHYTQCIYLKARSLKVGSINAYPQSLHFTCMLDYNYKKLFYFVVEFEYAA
jgi:hypothetical protein